MINHFKKIKLVPAIALSLGVLSLTCYAAERNESLHQLCAGESLLVKHSVTVSRGKVIAKLRADYLQTGQALSAQQRATLPTSGIDMGSDCREYLAEEEQTQGPVARVYFDHDSSRLTQASRLTLDTLAERQVKSKTPTQHLLLVGHTDNSGTHDYNLKLGSERAEQSKDYLVEQGLPGHQIETESQGMTQPIADNNLAQGRARNRRVEIFSQ